jgi:hypothetical protein
MEQPLYEPEISSYWRVSSTYSPVSGWLFDVAEIGKHWLSSESLGDFTSSHRRPSRRVPCTFHEYNTDSTGRSADRHANLFTLFSTMSREDKHVYQILLWCGNKQFIQLLLWFILNFKVEYSEITHQTAMHRLRWDLYVIFLSCHLRYEIIHRLPYIAYYTPR